MMFAEAIKPDRQAKVISFKNVYNFLGYERYDVAVEQLKKLFQEPWLSAVQSTSSDLLKRFNAWTPSGILTTSRTTRSLTEISGYPNREVPDKPTFRERFASARSSL